MEEMISAHMDRGEYYNAQMMYKTLAFRMKKRGAFGEAAELLGGGAERMLRAGQYLGGSELGQLMIQVGTGCKRGAFIIFSSSDVHGRQSCRERGGGGADTEVVVPLPQRGVRAAESVSADGHQVECGHTSATSDGGGEGSSAIPGKRPSLPRACLPRGGAGHVPCRARPFHQRCLEDYTLSISKDSQPISGGAADLLVKLVNSSLPDIDEKEVDLFVVRAMLKFLCLGDLKNANLFMNGFKEVGTLCEKFLMMLTIRLKILFEKHEPTPLSNFAHFLLLTLGLTISYSSFF